jgi:hypothetical protein
LPIHDQQCNLGTEGGLNDAEETADGEWSPSSNGGSSWLAGDDRVVDPVTRPGSSWCDYRLAVAALGMDALQAQIRQVFFFDTLELTLNGAGVVVRARRIQGNDRRACDGLERP